MVIFQPIPKIISLMLWSVFEFSFILIIKCIKSFPFENFRIFIMEPSEIVSNDRHSSYSLIYFFSLRELLIRANDCEPSISFIFIIQLQWLIRITRYKKPCYIFYLIGLYSFLIYSNFLSSYDVFKFIEYFLCHCKYFELPARQTLLWVSVPYRYQNFRIYLVVIDWLI